MKKSLGEKLRSDRRIKEAKRLIKEALKEHQSKLVHVQSGIPQQQRIYKKEMDHIGQLRGRPLFFPYIGSGIGRGALVELADGTVKYDFITGIGVYLMGHSHPDIITSGIDAAIEDTVMQGNLQFSLISGEFMNILVKAACSKGAALKHCFVTTSGAMANENALKIVLQKNHPARRILAFKGCFAGRTLAVAQITDRPEYRVGLPKALSVDHIPFFDASNPKESTQKAASRLKELLKKNKNQYAGMFFELIQGEKGAFPGSKDFFVALMKILKQHKVAVIIDEIQTFGRTSQLFAFQHFGLDKYADVVTVGKMSQACATLFRPELNPQPGLLSQTFTASTSALYAGKCTIEHLLKGGFYGPKGKVMKLSKRFIGHLEKMAKDFPDIIKGPFGIGAMIGFTYKDGSPQEAKKFLTTLYNNGVLAFVAGKNPMRIRFLMPIGAITGKDIDSVCRIIRAALDML